MKEEGGALTLPSDADLPEGVEAPRRRDEFVGHEGMEEELLGRAEGGEGGVWLLSGPRGVGKATLAFRMARRLLGEGVEGGVSGRVGSLSSPYFHLLTRREDDKGKAPRFLSVGEVRKAREFFELTGGKGGLRVCVVDGADEMNLNAANALLKTLEEPPRGAYIYMTASRPGLLPLTVRSRCEATSLGRLTDEESREVVDRALLETEEEQERVDVDLACRLERGAPGGALRLLSNKGAGVGFYRRMVLGLSGGGGLEEAADFGRFSYEAAMGVVLGLCVRTLRGSLGLGGSPPMEEEGRLYGRVHSREGVCMVWEKARADWSRTDWYGLDTGASLLETLLMMEEMYGGGAGLWRGSDIT